MNRRNVLIGLIGGVVATRASGIPQTAYVDVPEAQAAGWRSIAGMEDVSRAGSMTQIFTREFGAIGWWPIGDGEFHDEWIGGCVVAGRTVCIGARP